MKNILESIGMSISNAVDYVVEKNRRAAQINRLKMVIRREERVSEKAYIALGKYYYHNLRDEDNSVTEPHCAAAEQSSRRIDRALTLLEQIYAQSACNEACSVCCCGENDAEECCCAEDAEETCCCGENDAEECCCAEDAEETCCCGENDAEECCCAEDAEETCCCGENDAEECCCAEDAEETCCCGENDAEECCCAEHKEYTGKPEVADPRDNQDIPFE